MPQIPQVGTSVSANSSYSSTMNSSTQFDINSLDKTGKVNTASDKTSGGVSNSSVRYEGSAAVAIAKDPASAVDTLKDIISSDLISSAKLNGYTELAGDLDQLNGSLYMSPDKLVSEMLSQEEQNTMFSGDKLYDLLRNLASGGNADMNDSIGILLKALNFAQNKDEILGALSANMKFLSDYFSPNKSLSDKLLQLSTQWGQSSGENFESLKNSTTALLKELSGSILSDERTQTLIPLIINNLSKYNTNSYMLKEAFSQLLTQVSSSSVKSELTSSFDNMLKNIFGEAMDNITYNNNTTNNQKNQVGNEIFSKDFQNSSENAPLKGEIANLLGKALENQTEFSPDFYLRSYLLGKSDGMQTIKDMLSSLIEEGGGRNALLSDLSGIKSMTELVDYLNNILGEMPDIEQRQALFESLDELISHMADKNELPEKPQQDESGTLEKLTDFIGKNVNHPALKAIDGYNASNLLQSLLNAPGVFTPLAHYILPMQYEDTKAFGELWVDNDGKNSGKSGEKNYHLFLTFDVDASGRFEVDLYASGSDVTVGFMYPESYTEKVSDLTSKMSRFITSQGYNAKNIQTGVLKEPHSLSEVFPKIRERRSGLNVKA